MDLANATIAQVLVPVRNLDDAIEFYRYTLGLPFLFTAPPQMAFFQCGSVRLLVGVPPDSAGYQQGSAVYFKVSDILAVYTDLLERGVEFQAEPHIIYRTMDTDLWLAEFTDPDGNQLALMAETQAVE
jgi:predicted enzyme related to lactoylglutathione lyase